jgi:HTH-type transcriptional regulator / antitoxin HigA
LIDVSIRLAEAFPPGEFLATELQERHWSQSDFAEILGRPAQFVSEIISGKKEITRESAAQIGAALGTSPELWLNLQNTYLLWKQGQDDATRRDLNEVKLRARLNELAPIPVLRKRRILKGSTPAHMAEEIKDLYQLEDIFDEPTFLTAARRANADEPLSPTQKAWLACARRKARSRHARTYDPKALKDLAAQLPKILSSVEGFVKLPDLLADVGVRLVYVEAFPSSKISGSAFLLDDDRNHSVIAISGRGRRLDIVLFTLLHEVAHLIRGDVKRRGTILDEENGETIGDEEAADKMASDWLLPAGLEPPTSFLRHGWVESVAAAYGVHPIVVVGRLQKMGVLDWRTSLAKGAPTVSTQLKNW